MSVYVREAEVRVLKAATAFAEEGKKVSFSVNEMPSGIVHEVYEAVRELESVMNDRQAQIAFYSWYETIYKQTHLGAEQQAVLDRMREAFVAGWNKTVQG